MRDTLQPSNFTGYIVATLGEHRPYRLLQGFGVYGGKWMTKEVIAFGRPEVTMHDSRQDAEAHINVSQEYSSDFGSTETIERFAR